MGEISTFASAKTWSMCAWLEIRDKYDVIHIKEKASHFQRIAAVDGVEQRYEHPEEVDSGFE